MRTHSALAITTMLAAITLTGCYADNLTGVRTPSLDCRAPSTPNTVVRPVREDCDVKPVEPVGHDLPIASAVSPAVVGR